MRNDSIPPVLVNLRNGMPRTGQMFLCEVCGEPFYRYQADIRKAQTKGSRIRFCSKRCENRMKSSTNVALVCPECEKSFVVWANRLTHHAKNVYCSDKCRDTANGKNSRKRIEVLCSTCGKSLWRLAYRIEHQRHHFCSKKCHAVGINGWTRNGYATRGGREDLGHCVRSSWEANVCRVLLALGIPYEYEPRTFSLPSGTTYLPDLRVADSFWIEVKGWMRDDAAAKIAEFRIAYPDEILIVLGKNEYRDLVRAFGLLVPNWE